ncbi:Bug family tripartite tricarboxylate transporter substrate binding protein [Roseococcus pinisoli]|uniref:Tripartite tricarboxylate transporter substrate binding protein n=1 Tax=Roseococcus pinisoli TaxID=2835040 RepID=A0ABS5QHS9_9PROT|nr:tripartite tricarboxylate transporter substrate binding protein [Roseococcus pinisoli]MBS7813122.1 tripartite tricarboxylate transporter substrate binding protein [Roseococcus pinisoli]
MKNFRPSRRQALAAVPAALAAAFAPAGAQAQAGYPDRPITLVDGFVPGGGSDIVARLLATRLQAELGQPVVVENRPGASGTLGVAGVLRARADGYTLAIGTISSLSVLPQVMVRKPYNPLTDITPILTVASVPQVVVVNENSPFRTLGALLEHAKANPGKLNFASSGIATSQHLAGELLARSAGVEMTHVPYRGSGQALADLMAGQVDLNVDTLPTNLPHIRAGKLRALAVTTPERVEWLPDVPTVAESGFPGFDRKVWYMIVGPAGLPAPIAERWATALNAALATPEIAQRLREAGFMLGGGTLASTAAMLRSENERNAVIARQANISID